jgi:hypothetical protein
VRAVAPVAIVEAFVMRQQLRCQRTLRALATWS